MGRLTIEKENKIYEIYQNELSYEKTARKAEVSPKTVKKIVISRRPEKQPNGSDILKSPTRTSNISPEQRKTLYKEFEKGTDRAKIVTTYGFSPQIVIKEYESYSDLKGSPELKKFSDEILDFTGAKNIPHLKEFYETFVKNGFLTITEIRELLDEANENIRDLQAKNRNEGVLLPTGWEAVCCNQCGMLLMAAQKMDFSGQSILSMAQKLRHIGCNGNIVLRGY